MSRPIIGIVANYAEPANALPHARLNRGYYESVYRAGGLPIILPPTGDVEAIDQFLDSVGAVLFGGGPDVSPVRYGAQKHEKTEPLAAVLEEFIFATLSRVQRRPSLPVLGICLGCQVFNVARGGSLHQHVPDLRPERLKHATSGAAAVGYKQFHRVRIEGGTLLHKIIGLDELETNSSHHQAVDRVGQGLVVSAHSPDGVVEAVEDPARRFFLAVQWHPEELGDRWEHMVLFESLVRAAAR